MMLFALGLLIGFVIGLTGAGGALITMPIFMQLYHLDLKQASFYSLISVILGAVINFLFQYRDAKVSLGVSLCLASLFGSWMSQPFKAQLPDSWLSVAIAILALYSLYGVWRPRSIVHLGVGDRKPKVLFVMVFITILMGLFLGALTTFTGLGGGVIMLPILLSFYQLEQTKAVATSLLIVAVSSMISFLIQLVSLYQQTEHQFSQIQLPFSLAEMLSLTGGILLVAFFLKKILIRLPVQWVTRLRKITFTFVVGLALSKLVDNI